MLGHRLEQKTAPKAIPFLLFTLNHIGEMFDLPRIRKKNEIRIVIVILVVSLNQTENLRTT